MSPLPSLTQVRCWRELLLEQPVHPDLATALPDFLKQIAQDHLLQLPAELSNAQVAQLNRWYASAAGQGALVSFARTLWNQMSRFAEQAMPAHDARHAMYKVPATCLEYVCSENVQGWQRVGVLGALLHDHGRWAEERIFGWPGASVVHARLSFLLGREVLEPFEMPVFIKRHILTAALQHTSGATPADPMTLKLTVSADRDQLYGPEIILRMAHHAVGRMGGGSSYYGEQPGRTVLSQLESFLTNRLPGPLFSRDDQVHGLRLVLARFLLIAEAADASHERFTRFLAAQAASADSRPFDWAAEYEGVADLRDRATSPHDAMLELLSAPHIAPSPVYKHMALEKVAGVAGANRSRLASALRYANETRVALDAQQYDALQKLAAANADDSLIGCVAELLTANWFGTETTVAAAQQPQVA